MKKYFFFSGSGVLLRIHQLPLAFHLYNFYLILIVYLSNLSLLILSCFITLYTLQGLTIDSRMSDAAPPRVILGEVVPDIKAFYEDYRHQQQQLQQLQQQGGESNGEL